MTTLPDHVHLPTGPDEVDNVCGRFANWPVLAHHVTRHEELLRPLTRSRTPGGTCSGWPRSLKTARNIG